jgi:Zn-finger nucleic acid-binding protein
MSSMTCPRCTATMKSTDLGQLCPGCDGCWLNYEQLNASLRLSDSELENSELANTVVDDHADTERERYLRCPQCSTRMRRQIYLVESGVVVDTCREHGIWLDDGELGKIRRYLHHAESAHSELPAQDAQFFRQLLGG